MYTNSAYWNQSKTDFHDQTHPLFIESCGICRLYTLDKRPTNRPNGRLDYQILYVAAGKAYFMINGKERIVESGNMVIYRPKEPQLYYYHAVDQTEVCWIHFTGNDVENILNRYGIHPDTHVFYTGTSMEYKNLFLSVIQELQLTKEDYEEMLVHYFMELLIRIHRMSFVKPHKKSMQIFRDMDEAVEYFRQHYSEPISVEAYAAEHNVNTGGFIKNFRAYTGTTPAQFIQSVRMMNARVMLETTDNNISEIADLVGYDDPLYFSRLFRKQFGCSPSQFRKRDLS